MFIDAAISRMCAPDIPCAKIDFDYVIHTVAVSRLTPIVQLIDGDPELMRPKAKNDVPPF